MCLFFLMIRRPPRSTRTDTLSLHDALPISQIAATLLGIGDQIGYAGLIDKRLGITLDKSLSRTDWARRPLKDAELAYAAADVSHLATIYGALQDELAAAGRLGWLAEDCARLARSEERRVGQECVSTC